jgi:hypothetical protein
MRLPIFVAALALMTGSAQAAYDGSWYMADSAIWDSRY